MSFFLIFMNEKPKFENDNFSTEIWNIEQLYCSFFTDILGCVKCFLDIFYLTLSLVLNVSCKLWWKFVLQCCDGKCEGMRDGDITRGERKAHEICEGTLRLEFSFKKGKNFIYPTLSYFQKYLNFDFPLF